MTNHQHLPGQALWRELLAAGITRLRDGLWSGAIPARLARRRIASYRVAQWCLHSRQPWPDGLREEILDGDVPGLAAVVQPRLQNILNQMAEPLNQ